jgi:biopolymer transport protein ExbB/TolQ
MEQLFYLIGVATYGAQALVALWGAFNAVLAWRRVARVQFRRGSDQDRFLDELEDKLQSGQFDDAAELTENDRRAMPQLALYAIENRDMDYQKLQRRLTERLQNDVLADLEHRLSWIGMVIKTAPMLGLIGTVIGMMGAFANLGSGTKVDPGRLATDIFFALITTAIGLATAMPLLVCLAAINVRIRKMEDSIASGLTRLVEAVKFISAPAAIR